MTIQNLKSEIQNPRLAQRMSRLGSETAFDVLARAKALEAQGREIIHLELGEPDFLAAPHVTEAAMQALQAGDTRYNNAAGIPAFREAIARHISRTRGVDIQPEQVVVTPGAKPIMFFAILALLEAGDEAIYPNPGFPIYESMINFAGAKPVPLPLREESAFRFNANEFRALLTERTRLIILNSPHNPSGGVLARQDVEAIAEAARERDIMVLSDEVYNQIIYQGEHVSPLSLSGMQPHTILLDGFSKTYAMGGWRLGYGVMPLELAEHVTKLVINSNSCTPPFIQRAGIAALEGPQDQVAEMVAAFAERRELIVDRLNKIPGFRCVPSPGAFYVFPNITQTGMSSKALSDYLLEKAGVALLGGDSFGRYGEGYLRISYANSMDNIRAALERIERAMRERAE
ncbi:MAG TPA: pyridoxal phosphate-dependent aminotransferase [Chloroflexi bacterium]|nr:pyridoxal phosphate-dependent aminotransferase [Chloroflexota bacterium]